jgi:hypothetical protein
LVKMALLRHPFTGVDVHDRGAVCALGDRAASALYIGVDVHAREAVCAPYTDVDVHAQW